MTRMRRAELAVENYEAMYEFYARRTPNMPLARFAHGLFDMYYDATYDFMRDTEAVTGNHLAGGGNLLIPMNHTSIHDQFVAADMANHNTGLRPLRGTNVIPAKVELFENAALRFFLNRLGAMPTHRSMDIARIQGLSAGQAESLMTYQKLAGQKLVETCIEKYDSGESVAIFPENTRNKGDVRVLQRLKQGVGKIACGIESDGPVLFMPVGIYYGGYGHSNRKPYVALDHFWAEPSDPGEVTNMVAERLQNCVNRAVEMSGNPSWPPGAQGT